MTDPRPLRRHLHVARPVEEWPDDVVAFLERARHEYVDEPEPIAAPEVLAYLEVPAHGLTGPGFDSEEHTQALLINSEIVDVPVVASRPANRRPRRALVAAGGAAAALALLGLGLRPVLTGASATEASLRATAPAKTSGTEPAPASTARTQSVKTVASAASASTRTAPASTTTAAPTPRATASSSSHAGATRRPSHTSASSTSPAAAGSQQATTGPAAPTAPATPAPSQAAVVERYYNQNRAWRKCVVGHPADATRTVLAAACGAQPVPPANLAQYWAARDDWSACAAPLQAKHWRASRITARCGAKPTQVEYGVPPNPYSTQS